MSDARIVKIEDLESVAATLPECEKTDPELALMAGVARGDEDAFETIYRDYFPRLCGFVHRLTSDSAAVEEIVNEALYVVWHRADSFKAQSKLSTWIFGIAHNKVRQHLKRKRSLFGFISLESQPELPVNDEWAKQLEHEDLLKAGFEHLSADHRAVVELTYYHGMSYSEIAEVMRCPENTVKTRMYHARRKLSDTLRRIGLGD